MAVFATDSNVSRAAIVVPPSAARIGFRRSLDPGIPAPVGTGVTRYVSVGGLGSTGEGTSPSQRISLARAYQIALPGDVVVVADGVYGQFWAGGNQVHANGPTFGLNGTASAPVTFVGETPPSFDKNAPSGFRFAGTTSNSTNPLYLGNTSHVRWWRFTASGGQSALVVGNETGKHPMGPAHHLEFRHHHLFAGNQELVVVKHDSYDISFVSFLHEDSNVAHVDIGADWVALGWGPEPRSQAAIDAGVISPHFLGEAVYWGYNSTGERTDGAHAAWPAATGPGAISFADGTWRNIEGGEVIDGKGQRMLGDATVTRCVVDGCSSIFNGVFTNARSGTVIRLRDVAVHDVSQHWTSRYRQSVAQVLGGNIEIDNLVAWDAVGVLGYVGSGSLVGRHVTGHLLGEGVGAGSWSGCVDLGGSLPLPAGWVRGALADVVGPTDGLADAGLGPGSGFRPRSTPVWANGAAAIPAADLVGVTRRASAAAGALEP